MMRSIQTFILLFLLAVAHLTCAQRYATREGVIQFYSKAPLEDINAVNKKTSAAFNGQSGKIAFIVPVNQFQFPKKLMQEHFNEKYMESDRFPQATFAGTITGFDPALTTQQQVTATGKLTIHGVTQPVEVTGTLQQQNNDILLKSVFLVKLADYQITIPQLLWQNIAEQIEVTLDLRLKPQP